MPYLFFAQQIFLDGLAKRKGISQKIAIFPFLAQNRQRPGLYHSNLSGIFYLLSRFNGFLFGSKSNQADKLLICVKKRVVSHSKN